MTTTKQRPFWTPNPIKLPDGHRLFQAAGRWAYASIAAQPDSKNKLPLNMIVNRRGMWAMADDSGTEPQDTDDGILWLDFSRDLRAGSPRTNVSEGSTPGIPLLDKDAKMAHTICDTCTLLKLSVLFSWHINSLGKVVQVVEV